MEGGGVVVSGLEGKRWILRLGLLLRRIGDGLREYLKKWAVWEGRVDTCEIDECVMSEVLRGLNKRMLRESSVIRGKFVTFELISREFLVQNPHPMASQSAVPPG